MYMYIPQRMSRIIYLSSFSPFVCSSVNICVKACFKFISFAYIPNIHRGNLLVVTMFSYLWDRVYSIFRGAGKFSLARGLRQLILDVKSDVRILNFRTDVTIATPRKLPNDVRKRSLCDKNAKCQKCPERNDG